MLKLAGRLQVLGNLQPQDIPPDTTARASAVLALPDARLVIIQGLTQEECRQLSGDFGEPLTLRLEGLPV